jgi:long-chain acyl-CoA synthetase
MEHTRIFDILDLYRHPERFDTEAFGKRINEKWTIITGREYLSLVNELSLGLLELGVTKGDNIATIMKNSPEWNIIDMALLQIGAVQVPIYPTISTANYRFIFNDAKVKMVFITDESIYERFKEVLPDCASIESIYSFEPTAGLKDWHEILELGKNSNKRNELDSIRTSITESELATLIYTSGTTGSPKGVMLSHRNLVSNSAAAAVILSHNPVKRALSFLPLCHVLERIMNYTYQQHGAAIYYCDNIEQLSDYIKTSQPEMFAAVPRVLEKTYDKILTKGRNLKGIKKILFFWALRLGEQYEPWGNHGIGYRIQLAIARKLIFSKWKEAFGGKLNAIVSGGASLQERLARIFWAAGFQVIEGYGLSETSPVIAVGNFEPKGVKVGTVGPVLPGVEVKIAADGEILCKGPNVMLGYYKRDDLTKEVFDEEGWFHTGDIGTFEGIYLRITDRKKEIFKTSNGKYVAPQPIENKLKESAFIENALVVGDSKNFAGAIIIPDFNHIASWCRVKGREYSNPQQAIGNEIIRKRIEREINQINAGLDQSEQIKRFVLITDSWNVDSGELSPTMKLKRKFLVMKYDSIIEEIYSEKA